MEERDKITASHQELTETIELARGIVQGAVTDFLKDVQDAQRMCEKAEAIAREWNQDAETLALPNRFIVDVWGSLPDLLGSVKHLDIYTPEGSLRRVPVSSKDLEPKWIIPPRQKKVA